MYNFDLIKFYQNFLNLIVDVQLDNGDIPDFVPGNIYDIDPNWGTAIATIPWQIYRHYNDVQTLEKYYDPMVSYVKYIHNGYNKTGLVNLRFRYGDWVPPAPHSMTNQHLTASFAFLHDVNLLINISQILGKHEDTNYYATFYEKLAQEFHQVFYNTSLNYYADGLQAAQVFALALPNVVPANVRQTVIDHLVNDINQNGKHVTTGILSTAQIYPLLSDNGHHDLALEMISSITYPSFGYMFNNPYENATTVWELWNTATSGPGMNSRNHIMFGSVGAWFYSHLAGIDHSSNSFITIRPRMASESKKHLMSKLDCQLSISHGLVHVSYTRDEQDTIAKSILLKVKLPPNTQGRVIFEPLFVDGKCKTLLENGRIIWSSDNDSASVVHEFEIENDPLTNLMSVYISSGESEFRALWQ